ncbi:MAG: outer membrane beta-barrel protein, partial [Candidatus Omnitrophica bacterium]|nr:outer membrane beta-barrel protein [Candidatus Omnitrophota bacterium]
MKKSFLKIAILFIIISMVIGSDAAFADFRIKPFNISLGVTESLGYSSNPGYSNKKCYNNSFYNKMQADLGVELPFGKMHRYSWNSSSDWLYNFQHSEYTTLNNRFSQSVDLVFNKWTLNIHQNLTQGQDPTVRERTVITTNSLLKRLSNNVGFVVRGDLGKLKLATGFDYLGYSANKVYNTLDRDEFSYFLEGGVELTPRITAFVRGAGEHTNRRSSNFNNNTGWSIVGGARGDITPYLVGEVSAGGAWRDYKKGANNQDSTDYAGLLCNVALTNRLSTNTTQRLSYSFSPEPGYDSNFYRSSLLQYGVNHRLNSRITLNATVDWENVR